jgi:hypothetical protein
MTTKWSEIRAAKGAPPTARCKCHPVAFYGGCMACPRCRHWSFDPTAGACERRKCGYEAVA